MNTNNNLGKRLRIKILIKNNINSKVDMIKINYRFKIIILLRIIFNKNNSLI